MSPKGCNLKRKKNHQRKGVQNFTQKSEERGNFPEMKTRVLTPYKVKWPRQAVRPPNGGSGNDVLCFDSHINIIVLYYISYINGAWGGQHGSAGPPPSPPRLP